MRKPEIQPPIPHILRRLQILCPLLNRHPTPDLLPAFIPPNIVQLRAGVQNREVEHGDGDEDGVAASVARSVVCAVDVGVDDGAGLDEHVV